MSHMRSAVVAAMLSVLFQAPALAEIAVPIARMSIAEPRPPVLSNLDPLPADAGQAGAELGLKDNQTTGRFMGHAYSLTTTRVGEGEDPLPAARTALMQAPFLLIDGPAEALTAIADLPEAKGKLLFNTGAEDPALRSEACRANVLHTVPSLAMRTDALVQFFVTKRWSDIVMITGPHPKDRAYSAAMERSLAKFRVDLAATKNWTFDADMRRNAAQEVPLFTQDFGDYDALVVADETHDFGRYILYNTWEARPVTGSEGLTAVAWAPVVEQWGAAQLQSRFQDLAGRAMRPEDYANWAAIRAIGEAVTRTGSGDPATLRDFMLSDDFELAGFKGRPLTFRPWNGQLRQPIPLVHPRALVASAPLDGFLHQRSELDTLGLDQPESACTAFVQ